LRSAFPDLNYEEREIISQGNKVIFGGNVNLSKYPDLSRVIIVLLHWGQISSMMLSGTEAVSNDCLLSNDTLREGNSKPQL
jgi:hypothetical protein